MSESNSSEDRPQQPGLTALVVLPDDPESGKVLIALTDIYTAAIDRGDWVVGHQLRFMVQDVFLGKDLQNAGLSIPLLTSIFPKGRGNLPDPRRSPC